jgi:hypothetical protein
MEAMLGYGATGSATAVPVTVRKMAQAISLAANLPMASPGAAVVPVRLEAGKARFSSSWMAVTDTMTRIASLLVRAGLVGLASERRTGFSGIDITQQILFH